MHTTPTAKLVSHLHDLLRTAFLCKHPFILSGTPPHVFIRSAGIPVSAGPSMITVECELGQLIQVFSPGDSISVCGQVDGEVLDLRGTTQLPKTVLSVVASIQVVPEWATRWQHRPVCLLAGKPGTEKVVPRGLIPGKTHTSIHSGLNSSSVSAYRRAGTGHYHLSEALRQVRRPKI